MRADRRIGLDLLLAIRAMAQAHDGLGGERRSFRVQCPPGSVKEWFAGATRGLLNCYSDVTIQNRIHRLEQGPPAGMSRKRHAPRAARAALRTGVARGVETKRIGGENGAGRMSAGRQSGGTRGCAASASTAGHDGGTGCRSPHAAGRARRCGGGRRARQGKSAPEASSAHGRLRYCGQRSVAASGWSRAAAFSSLLTGRMVTPVSSARRTMSS